LNFSPLARTIWPSVRSYGAAPSYVQLQGRALQSWNLFLHDIQLGWIFTFQIRPLVIFPGTCQIFLSNPSILIGLSTVHLKPQPTTLISYTEPPYRP